MNDGRFRDVVPTDSRLGSESAHRGDIQNNAAVVFHVLVPRGAHVGEHRGLIYFVGLSHAGVIDVDQRSEIRVRCGVIDQNVQRPEALQGSGY